MVINLYIFISIILSLFTGILLTWLIMRSKAGKQSRIILQHQEDKNSLETKISDLNAQFISLDKEFAVSKQQVTRITILESEIIEYKNKIEEINASNVDLQRNIAELETRNQEERKNSEEKLSLLNDAKKELSNQFKVLANEILDEKGKNFSELNKEKLDVVLNPFNEQLKEFRKKWMKFI